MDADLVRAEDSAMRVRPHVQNSFIIDLKKNIQKIAFFFLKRGPDTAYKNRPKCLEIKIKSTGTK